MTSPNHSNPPNHQGDLLNSAHTDARPVEAIILAAGKGTRMKSDLPKVLHPVADKPMLNWVIEACLEVGCRRVILVVGYEADKVREAVKGYENIVDVVQEEQLGTGHAAQMAEPLFKETTDSDVFVLAGDGPLIHAQTLKELLEVHRDSHPDKGENVVASATLATATLEDPTGYGRVVRDMSGKFVRIVEHKDASEDELAIREVNPSYYCFDASQLFSALSKVSNDNRQGEYYLTDVPQLLKNDGQIVRVIDAVPAEDVLSINTPEQLAEVDRIMRSRLALEGES